MNIGPFIERLPKALDPGVSFNLIGLFSNADSKIDNQSPGVATASKLPPIVSDSWPDRDP